LAASSRARECRHERCYCAEIPPAEPARRLCAYAIFQGLPTFAIAVLMLKLTGSHQLVDQKGGAAIFVVLATLFYALIGPPLGRKFSKTVQERLRAAVLRRQPVVYREDRDVADPAGGIAATADDSADAVAVGGGRSECGVIFLSSSFRGAAQLRAMMCNCTSENP
jgi:hypothetical protein